MLSAFSLDSFQTACLDQKMPKHNPIHWLWSNVVHRKWRPGPSLDLDTRVIFPSWFYQTAGGIQKFQKVERESLIIDTLSKRGVQCWGRFLGHQKPASSRRMDISCRTSQISDGIGVWEKEFWIAILEKSRREKWDPNWGKCVEDLRFIHGSHHWSCCITLRQFFREQKN